MSEKGYVGDYTVVPENQLSEKMKQDLNDQTQKMFQECLKDVEELLKKESVILDRFANELLEKEELEYDDIEAIFKEYGKSREQLEKEVKGK